MTPMGMMPVMGVLRRAAERLRACVRAGDTIARLGGDELFLVLENIADGGDVDHVCYVPPYFLSSVKIVSAFMSMEKRDLSQPDSAGSHSFYAVTSR